MHGEECPNCKCAECEDDEKAYLGLGFLAGSPDIGVTVFVSLSSEHYTEDEEQEIADMVIRVITAWSRRRATMLANPGLYGIQVN